MTTIYQATLKDIPIIQEIARVTFPVTYRDIITPEQKDFMMEMMYAKGCRGAMARYVIQNRIGDTEKLKGFSVDGFTFHSAEDGDNLVFTN